MYDVIKKQYDIRIINLKKYIKIFQKKLNNKEKKYIIFSNMEFKKVSVNKLFIFV
jgi:hypothetical protein